MMSVQKKCHSPRPTSELLQIVEKMKIKSQWQAVRAPVQINQSKYDQVMQLPLWPEGARGVPNAALRSALFGVIKKGVRSYVERQEIHAQEGVKITYTGARLDQCDLDVWETVLHVARMQALGDECRVTAYQLLKMLGKTDTGSNRATLKRRLSRMKATALDISVGRYGYEGSLIDEVYRNEGTSEYVIRLNPKLCVLFASDQFTQIDWSLRHALDGKQLAQWLHGYYASHAKPFPVGVSTIHRLCGSEAILISDFKKDLKRALNAVAEAAVTQGQKFNFAFKGDLVHIEKIGSSAQHRHLVKAKVKLRLAVAAPP